MRKKVCDNKVCEVKDSCKKYRNYLDLQLSGWKDSTNKVLHNDTTVQCIEFESN